MPRRGVVFFSPVPIQQQHCNGAPVRLQAKLTYLKDTQHTKGRVEIVVQWQRFKRIPNPYFQACSDKYPFYRQDIKENDDWTFRSGYGSHGGGGSGDDDKGRYLLEGKTEVYYLTPKRTGKLKISKDIFCNLPDDYKFIEKTITVKD